MGRLRQGSQLKWHYKLFESVIHGGWGEGEGGLPFYNEVAVFDFFIFVASLNQKSAQTYASRPLMRRKN